VKGCERDTDGDGNCAQHREGCPKPPEPMSEERLKEIEQRLFLCTKPQWIYIEHAQREATADVRNDSGAEVAMGIYTPNAAFIAHARQDVPALLAEVRRLREKYEGKAPRCNGGHENNLPLALWDCPTCTEALRRQLLDAHGVIDELLKTRDDAANLLLERARQAEELLAWNAEARAHLLVAQGGLGSAGNYADDRGDRYIAEARNSEAGKIGLYLNETTPAAALELQRARRAVVEASVKVRRLANQFSECWKQVDWADALPEDQPLSPALIEYERVQKLHDAAWKEWEAAVDALEKLEASAVEAPKNTAPENGGSGS
jgi:cell division septum initiation protein DivIVA